MKKGLTTILCPLDKSSLISFEVLSVDSVLDSGMFVFEVEDVADWCCWISKAKLLA